MTDEDEDKKGREEQPKAYTAYVEAEDAGVRLDKFLSLHYPIYSRSFYQKLLEQGDVQVNNKAAKPGCRLQTGDIVDCVVPALEKLKVKPEDIPLNILYEDDDIVVINKEKGMVVHPAAGHRTGTIVNALLFHCEGGLSGINGVIRPGIVHRIDQDTTGVIVVCKNDNAHRNIAEQLKNHSITRTYHALVYGAFKEESGMIDAPVGRHPVHRKKMAVNYINGKHAVTHYRLLENYAGKYAYITCNLETGRTHQIRVHMAGIHHPLLGDTVYGTEKDPFHLQGQALHAAVLGFIHPSTNEYMEFQAPLPEYFCTLLEKFRSL